ncbi:hypothetical protein GLW04_06895 [Halobacillus litoralis]|uniref:Uncharacterized protein n=1 Tax=Halobacillus litoralis TaxID=45668 RepID=A0A845E1N4_9BACI|nr:MULTISPECIES: hypothetical protein [Halobacillus]MCA1022868.1 hypothetical protein [Halobacillus litoralis]MYL19614.1 hypothetical protein [Halobacillus litoralis]MYL28759.1 hypothetical protein [Halobacillus halophilus]MYL37008.1 hypothetical protein [Halobacillus litoralis]
MKRVLLIILGAIDILYMLTIIFRYDFTFEGWISLLFGVTFTAGIVVSALFIFQAQYKKGFHPILSIFVLAMSAASLAWLAFFNFLADFIT